jgi:hypothetical protein
MAVPIRARKKQKESAVKSGVRYAHLPLGKDVEAFAGYYTPENEVRLKYNDREVLYITGHLVIEATCCAEGDAGCRTANYWYALVPGYVVEWQVGRNKEGLPVSIVELITDQKTQEGIRRKILENEAVSRVDFW